MRICYLHQYFNTLDDVGGTRSYEFSKRLTARGHEVNVLTTNRKASRIRWKWRKTEIEGFNVYEIDVPYNNAMNFFSRVYAFVFFAVVCSIKACLLKSDIIFATSTPLTIAIPGMIASKIKRIPMVFEVRDLWPEMPIAVGALRNKVLIYFARLLERMAYHSSRRVIALSPGMADGVAATGYPREHIRVIPNSSDNHLFDAADPSKSVLNTLPLVKNKKIVLYAGTFGVLNNVGYLVDLAKELRFQAPDVMFVAVGSGAEWELVRQRALQAQVLEKNFLILPAIAKRDIPSLYRSATVVMSLFSDIPAMWKNSANKFFDGLAAAKPLAINYEGWMADLIRSSNAGVVLHPHDMTTSGVKLMTLLGSSQDLDLCAKGAKHLATTSFDRDNLFIAFEKALLESCKN